jgi:AraC-like DNA-binding protein
LELTKLTQFIRGEPDMFVSEDAQNLSVEIGTLDAPMPVRHCMTEMILTSMNQLVTHFAGSGAGASRILLDYPAPSHVARYHELFSCEIHFDQPRAGLVVSREMAERVQLTSQPALADHLRRIADQELSTSRSNGLVEQVRSQLRVSAEPDPVGMAGVARRLGMSERSLRRQLAAQGVDYRTILKERRQEIASLMLMKRGVAVKHVAHELGYRSTSAFQRAFKRWMGSSPSVYANDARNGDRLQ